MGCGLGCGGVTNFRGLFCLMVTSLATASSSHSLQVSGNARFLCLFGGSGAEMGVGFRVAEGGELGVGSSHSSWVNANIFFRCFRGGGGEVRA